MTSAAVDYSGYVAYSDIDKMLSRREALYVRNKTSKPVRMLVINYPSPESPIGNAFMVPRSTVPFNICDFVDPESLRGSKTFKQILHAGGLELVDPKQARAELSDPERIKAFRAAFDEANNTYRARAGELKRTQEASAAEKASQQKLQSQGMRNIIQAMDPTMAKALSFVGADGIKADPKLLTDVSPRLVGLERRFAAGDVDETSVMIELSLMLGDLTTADLEKIASDAAWPRAAQSWARERIAYAQRSATAMGASEKA